MRFYWEAVKYYIKKEHACWYEPDNEVLNPDEDKKVVSMDEAYLEQHLPTVRRRMAQARVRLGGLLNEMLGRESGKKPNTPVPHRSSAYRSLASYILKLREDKR
jgi:hypothetical protein